MDLNAIQQFIASLWAKPHFSAPMAPGMLVPPNIDLTHAPAVRNPNGSYSTIRTISVGNDQGQEVLIPTVVNGAVVSNADAIKHYQQTGRHLGVFQTPDHADAYAQQLHNSEATRLQQMGITQ